MHNFDDLQKDWKTVASTVAFSPKQTNSLFAKLKKLQRKIIFGNLLMSVSFAIVFIVFAWLWNLAPEKERSTNFYFALIFMATLLTGTLAFMWYRVLFWRTPNMIAQNMRNFATRMLKKLRYFKWITNFFMPVYLLLLAVGVTIFFQDILAEATTTYKVMMYGGTYIWLLFIGWIMIRIKRKKNQREIQPVIDDLQELLQNLKRS